MKIQSFGSFSGTSLGIGTAAAAAMTSPKPARRPEGCVSTPFVMVISAFGTFQALEAAAINIARAFAGSGGFEAHEWGGRRTAADGLS